MKLTGPVRNARALTWAGRKAVGDYPDRKHPKVPAVLATALAASIKLVVASMRRSLVRKA